jgi:hypothetical protein
MLNEFKKFHSLRLKGQQCKMLIDNRLKILGRSKRIRVSFFIAKLESRQTFNKIHLKVKCYKY